MGSRGTRAASRRSCRAGRGRCRLARVTSGVGARDARRNGIEAAATERVAPAQPPDRQPRAAYRAVRGHGLTRVLGTRRDEAARRRTVCAQLLVDVDAREQRFARSVSGFTAHRPESRTQNRAERARKARRTTRSPTPGVARTRYPCPGSSSARVLAHRGTQPPAHAVAGRRRRPPSVRPRTRHAAARGPAPSTAVLTSRFPPRRRRPRASARNDA